MNLLIITMIVNVNIAMEHAKKLFAKSLRLEFGDRLDLASKVQIIDITPRLTKITPRTSSSRPINLFMMYIVIAMAIAVKMNFMN